MTRLRPLVHVGYVKAASTFLQQAVFADPRFGFAEPVPDARLVITDRLQLSDPWSWDASAERAAFAAMNARVPAGLVPVWSEERLLGDPVQARYDGAVTAERLAAVMPHARVLIVVREQRALAASIYREVIHDGQALTLTDVIGTGDEPAGFRPLLREPFLAYSAACARYRALFGEAGVLVLPVELLAADPDDFLARLRAFAGAEGEATPAPRARVHAGLRAAGLPAARLANHLRRPSPRGHPVRPSDKLVRRGARALDRALPAGLHERAERRLRARVGARYEGRFARDNAALAAMTGLDLARYGYELPGGQGATA